MRDLLKQNLTSFEEFNNEAGFFDEDKLNEFIANLNSDKDTLGLVEAIMMVSRHYGLDVVAEGVEKREVLEVLRSLGCDKYQGAHFSMPVSLDRFQKLLVA